MEDLKLTGKIEYVDIETGTYYLITEDTKYRLVTEDIGVLAAVIDQEVNLTGHISATGGNISMFMDDATPLHVLSLD